ncbi:synaptonemal complex protein 2-like [Scyliorhinus torazame]|uniref:synaptonemal complex protein 2-like n=1 Tax=Scyliorhinus torazame TaxID=75743 RepID=UPI003B5CBB0B
MAPRRPAPRVSKVAAAVSSETVTRRTFLRHWRAVDDLYRAAWVSEAKRKVLGKKRLSFDQVNNLKVATGSKKRRRGGDAVHKRSDLKTFFTEDSSSGGTEHSWLLDSHIKVTPNIADYSRRKKRKKSVLRVLPLSLESSEDEKKPREATESLTPKENQEMSQIGQILSDFSDQQHTPVQHVKRIKTNDFSIRNNPVIGTSLLTPPDTQEMKLPSNRFPGRISTKGAGPTLQQSPSIPSEGPPSENNYLTKDEVSLTPSPHFKAKRLFTSAEKYKKAEELQDMVQEIEKSHSEFDDEDSSEPNISAAFRSFTEEMRKKLRFSYRKMEQHTKQSLQSAERKTLKLLNQIHKCRLQKLNMFEETVGQELKNLEEDAQTLKNLEEETLNFWKQQSLKFSQFYENQKQRMNAGILSPEDKRGLSKEMQVKTAHREQSAADRMKN